MVVDWGNEDDGDCNGEFESRRQVANECLKPIRSDLVEGKQTLMVNAAIMNERNERTNKLWLVELELPLVR